MTERVFAGDEPNRRNDIVRAAGRLFREKGYSATTIREIADAVAMRSGSPFYHFKTKHDILRAVVLTGVNAAHAAVTAAIFDAEECQLSARDTFQAMVQAHLEQLLGEEGRDCASAFLHETRHLEPATLIEVIALKDNYESLWQDRLLALKAEGFISDDRRLIRLFFMGAMNWATLWFKAEGQLTPPQLAKELTDFLVR